MGLATGDVVLVSLRGTLFGQRTMNVLRYVVTVPSTGASITQDLTDIADAFANTATATLPLNKLLPMQGASQTYDTVRAQRVYPARTVYAYSSVAATGTNASDCKTPNIAVSLTKRTLLAGRHGIGRMQIPAVPDAEITAGIVSNALITLGVDLGNQLIGEKVIGSNGLKIWACTAANVSALDSKVSSTQVQDTVRTMHRRTVRVGE